MNILEIIENISTQFFLTLQNEIFTLNRVGCKTYIFKAFSHNYYAGVK